MTVRRQAQVSDEQHKPLLLGAVDLGSNSFRVEIGRVDGERIVSESYWKETVRLAAGFDDKGALTPEVQERALKALARFREKLAGIDPKYIRAVGTQALRVATNSAQFLPLAEAALGHKIEIIAGREEARLVFSGCAHTLPPSNEHRLVVDIGGASTELIIGRGFTPESRESFHVGCVNTSVKFFKDGKVTAKAMKAAQLAAQAEFEDSKAEFSPNKWQSAYGSAGTIGAVAEIGHALGLTPTSVTWPLLKALKEQIIRTEDIKKLHIPGLKEDRREVIAGGVAVLSAVFETFGIKEMRPASGALRVGLLYDILGRKSERDIRDTTVNAIIHRTAVDAEQAQRVSSLALRFYAALSGDKYDEDLGKLLQWASLLHETGKVISPSGYHRHSQYILLNSDLPGFSKSDQLCMGTLVLGQRGNLKKVAPALENPSQAAMICALRLAVIFAHARRPVELPQWNLTRKGSVITLTIDADWLKQHPLTEYLLEQESSIWAKENISFVLQPLQG